MYKYSHTIEYNHSTTFGLGVRCTHDGVACDVSNMQITSFIRDANGHFITELVVTKMADTGLLHFTLPKGVVLPVRTLYMDVRVVQDDVERVSTERVRILVNRVVTFGQKI